MAVSLIESLTVMAIAATITAAAMPSISNIMQKAKIHKARAEVESLSHAVTMYYMDKGQYPSSLSVLAQGGIDAYIKTIPTDPWNHAYVYDAQANIITSYGADGQAGGTGRNTDIVSTNNI